MGTYRPSIHDRYSRKGSSPPVPLREVPHEAWNMEGMEPIEDGAEGTERVQRMVMRSGSSFELFASAIAIVLAIVGLVGYLPLYVAGIATIAVGLALLAQGSTIAARWQDAHHIAERERLDKLGMSTEMFGGLAAIVLGILALLGVASLTLLAVAAIVLGVSLLLGGGAQPEIAEDDTPKRWHVTRDAVRASSGVMVMGGLSSLVLGVIAVAADAPVLPLALTALLCVAAALMLAGGSLLARFRERLVKGERLG